MSKNKPRFQEVTDKDGNTYWIAPKNPNSTDGQHYSGYRTLRWLSVILRGLAVVIILSYVSRFITDGSTYGTRWVLTSGGVIESVIQIIALWAGGTLINFVLDAADDWRATRRDIARLMASFPKDEENHVWTPPKPRDTKVIIDEMGMYKPGKK